MDFIRVQFSSNVEAFAYDMDVQILAVKFHNDTTYIYVGVPHETAVAFANAKSKGAFVASEIKGKFPYYRLDKMETLVKAYRSRFQDSPPEDEDE